MKNKKINKVTCLLGLALVSGSAALMMPVKAQSAPYYQPSYNSSPSILLNGQPLTTSVPPIVRNGYTLVPMRDIFEALGATVVWDSQDHSIRARKDSTEIFLQIGNNIAHVDNRQVFLSQPPILQVGSTLVPLRFVSEALGANVSWDGSTRVVQITTNENYSAPATIPTQNMYNGNSGAVEQAPTQESDYENSDTDYNEFYDDLSPYGQWLEDPEYGYVWQPRVDESFRPYYTNGHWAMTEYGNTWVSDYPWGWATFHYGRWDLSDSNGWIWIPGSQWAPAWVSWRSGEGYYGWAPLGPSFNINISLGNYHAPNNWYAFVPQGHLYDHGYSHYNYNNYSPHKRYTVSNQIVNLIQRTTIVHNTYIHNNNTYITGPRINEVQSATHQKVRVYNISNSGRAGSSKIQNNSISIYRPAVNNHANRKNRTSEAPRNVVKLNHSIVNRSKADEVNRNGARNSSQNKIFPARNNHTNTAPRVSTPRNTTPNPERNGRNTNPYNRKNENFPARNNHTNTAPRVITPRNTAPNPEHNGRNTNPDNRKNENFPAHNDHTNTAPRVITPRNTAPNPERNGRNTNPYNRKNENFPAHNDHTNTAPRVSTPRNTAPNPSRNANDNNGRNKNAATPQARDNQSKGSTSSRANSKGRPKDNPNQSNNQKRRDNNEQTNNQ